jgi:site-specific DNA-methyltransferase (adenine-specific)
MTLQPYYHRHGLSIFHGDCRDVLPTLPAASVDFVLTDPPYLVHFKGRWDGVQRTIVGDDDPSWLRPAFTEVWRLLKPDSFCVSFYGWPHTDTFLGVWKAIGFRPVSHLAFVKRQWGLGRFTRGTHEAAYLLAKGKPPIPESAISDVIDWQREDVVFHPNQKPVSTLTPLIDCYCPSGGIVLDPFMGSGSTLRAAKDLGRTAIGIEIEPDYCRKAAARLAQGVFPLNNDAATR